MVQSWEPLKASSHYVDWVEACFSEGLGTFNCSACNQSETNACTLLKSVTEMWSSKYIKEKLIWSWNRKHCPISYILLFSLVAQSFIEWSGEGSSDLVLVNSLCCCRRRPCAAYCPPPQLLVGGTCPLNPGKSHPKSVHTWHSK